jgi:hypothetical protein
MSPLYRWVIKWSRTVHLYVTLFGLALLLLFAITGFMLNHEDWFVTRDPVTRTAHETLPTDLLREPLDRLAVSEYLRKHHGATGLVETFEVEDDSCRVVFKQVGRAFEASIQRETGETDITTTSFGVIGVLLDLHRVKSTGWIWSLAVDGLVVMLLVISITGLVLWWSLKGRGHWPALTMVLGTALFVAIYLFCVP